MHLRILAGLSLVLLFLPATLSAQSGTIRYERSITRDMRDIAAMMRPPQAEGETPRARGEGDRPAGRAAPGARRGAAGDELPVVQRYARLTVTFDGMVALTEIEEVEADAPEAPSDRVRRGPGGGAVRDGAIMRRVAQMMPRREDRSVWVDAGAGRVVRSVEFLTRDFLVEAEPPALRWRLVGEMSEFLGYAVQKAEAEWEGRTVEAWFTVDVPGIAAPDVFTGLPGIVLMVSVDQGALLIQATEVDVETPVDTPAAPEEGERVTPEEFEALVEERTEEFRQSLRSRLRRRGGGDA